MKAAAVAAQYGWDPLAYLALAPADMQIANLVIEEQARRGEELEQARADYQAGQTAYLTARPIVRILSRGFESLIRVVSRRTI